MNNKKYIVAGIKIVSSLGLIGVVVVAPNSIQAFDQILKSIDKRHRRAVQRQLKRQGYVKFSQASSGALNVSITQKGLMRYQKIVANEIAIIKPTVWDKKWRLVMFDIPETRKTGRDVLTRKVKELGFIQMQKSIWVHPYPCLNEIMQLSEVYGVEKYVVVSNATFDSKKTVELTNIFSNYI